MNVGQTIKNQRQAARGRIKETIGRASGNRRMEREGRADRTLGSLKQAATKVREAFRF
ncbi:CsbD family protein [Streptomyces ochraceiscleroticus]|uniref:CsbD family protein n=1 Tax=Streptomyces ochraceiscleroticus TaxID=47761 RepID=A0ABW1MNW4_9ACTN|nr:CsbD family protein [Streptomyces ochraceiscleroticus]